MRRESGQEEGSCFSPARRRGGKISLVALQGLGAGAGGLANTPLLEARPPALCPASQTKGASRGWNPPWAGCPEAGLHSGWGGVSHTHPDPGTAHCRAFC